LELTLEALERCRRANQSVIAGAGVRALIYLYRRGAFSDREAVDPAVVLLNLKRPKVAGLDVLAQIKVDPLRRQIPISCDLLTRDVLRSYELNRRTDRELASTRPGSGRRCIRA
jgi:CheY-like chemotaxis protein